MVFKHILVILLFVFSACVTKETPLATFSKDHALILQGDIVVTNTNSDSALLLDEDGNFKKLLYNVDNTSEQIIGVAWDPVRKEIVVSVNGTPDRVVAISPFDGTKTNRIVNAQYSGNPYGLTVDSAGEFYLIETHQIEKFDASYQRVSTGGFPTGTLITGLSQVSVNPQGGFVLCGTTGDVVATYDTSFTQVNSATSSVASTTDAYGCKANVDGTVVTSWSGATDTVFLYSADLATEIASYSDTSVLPNPRGIEIKSNGNILVADASYHYIVELDSNLQFVRVIGSGLLNSPWHILEVPSY